MDGIVDSLGEDADSPVPNITHRYPDRVLFLVSPVCAAYCRFCTRRRKVGDPEKIPLGQFDAAFDYIREHTEVRDVSLSGGDPLMLSDRRVEYFLAEAPGDPPRRDRAHPHPDPLAAARAHHAGALRDDQAVPPGVRERALQPSGRADAGHADGARDARRRRVSPRQPDRPPEGRERRSGHHEAADAGAAQVPGPALLPLPGRPRRGRRALPDVGREGPGDHRGAPGLDLGTGRPALRHRRARRRREDPAPARSTCSR